MREYEVVLTYLNGCAGAAYPVTTVEEIEAKSPKNWLEDKYGKNFPNFICEEQTPGHEIWSWDTGVISYRYEFTEL
jgi:hypothetical protein